MQEKSAVPTAGEGDGAAITPDIFFPYSRTVEAIMRQGPLGFSRTEIAALAAQSSSATTTPDSTKGN